MGGWKDARGWLYIHIGFGGVWDYRAVEKIGGQEQHMKRTQKKGKEKQRRLRKEMSDDSRDERKKALDGGRRKKSCVLGMSVEGECMWVGMYV